MKLPDLVHPDDVTGALSQALQLFSHPSQNTLADLDAYRGLSREELFPAPGRVRGARVALLYLHGYMQPETPLEELVVLAGMALRLDVEVIQLQPPYHGRRTPRGSRFGGELYWTADLVRSFEALRQNLLDARSLLGWLLEQDPRPVGVLGLSLGGALALTLTCLEERLAFSVPLVAHMDLAALQLFAASHDRFFDAAVVQELWRRWGRPAIHWVPSSHMGFIAHLPGVVAKVRTFIDRTSSSMSQTAARRPPAREQP